MKPMISILAMTLMVSMAPAQTKTAAPAAGKGVDTMQQAPAMQNQQMQRFGWREHEFPGFEKNRGTMFGNLGMHEKYGNQMGPACQTGPGCCGMCPMPGMRMHHFIGRHVHRVLFLGLLLMGILNVLLTIIVAVDMARIGKFNGLWVAVTLLCGVPGTAIYALFRIGDAIERVKQKT
ncbi:MAG: hypothetical protein WBM07_08100 [Chitinivibrionales bacterium]